ncbi:hypothetical protein [Streptomyces tibetensis]|uniref:hypothetical protein n=1 Tax=Streptomyces tibetensis TaxID=2382123 RepID=UPI0033FD88C1
MGPETCGFGSVEGLRGLWFVRGNVLRDLAVPNGVELLPWDGWEPWHRKGAPATQDDLAAADAARSEDDRPRLFADPRPAVPAGITSYATCPGERAGSRWPFAERRRLVEVEQPAALRAPPQ